MQGKQRSQNTKNWLNMLGLGLKTGQGTIQKQANRPITASSINPFSIGDLGIGNTESIKDDFELIKAKKGMAIAEFKPVTIYKCPICGDEIEIGSKVFVLSKCGTIDLIDNGAKVVVCHLKCAKRIPNIITNMFNDAIADKV